MIYLYKTTCHIYSKKKKKKKKKKQKQQKHNPTITRGRKLKNVADPVMPNKKI
jgi:hypothetical protein